MIDPKDVTACLVTRGNVDMQRIIDTLPYGEVLIWDNSKEDVDLAVFGRYELTKRASNPVIYWQDDDVIFTEHEKLLEAYGYYGPNAYVANNAHGPDPGGYEDLALQAAGALCDLSVVADTWARWFQRYPNSHQRLRDPEDQISCPPSPLSKKLRGDAARGTTAIFGECVLYEADFIFGVLCKRWAQIELPYQRLYAEDDTRLCRQPWQEDLKFYATNLARAIRDA